MLDFSDIKIGSVVVFSNKPCVVIKCAFAKVTKLKPVKKCMLRDISTGANYPHTYNSGDNIPEGDLQKMDATFLYIQGNDMVFMITDTYETVELPISLLEDKLDYLSEGLQVTITYFDEVAVAMELPIKISYKVVFAEEAVRGNTVSGVLKEARIDSGKIIKVPAFIKEGDYILVNTVEDEYVERDTSRK